MKKFAVICFAALGFSGLASASLIPKLDSVVGQTYNYTAALDNNEQLNNTLALGGNTCNTGGANVPCGQFFTLFDIPNLVSATTTAAGFTASVNLIGNKNILTGIVFPDQPTISNATFTYTAMAPLIGSAATQALGFFTVTTTGTVLGANNIAFAFNTAHMPDTGFADQGAGVVSGPLASVPEPSSMLLIGGGLMALGLLRRKLVH